MVEDSASLLRSSTCHWRKTRHGGRTLRTIAACAPTRDVQTIVGGHQRNKISTWHKYMRTQTGYNSFMIDPRGQPKREGKHTMGAVTDESLALLGTTQQSILGPTLASPGMGFATMVPKTLGIARPPSSAHAETPTLHALKLPHTPSGLIKAQILTMAMRVSNLEDSNTGATGHVRRGAPR